MKWFDGSIQEAVLASKKKKAIFVAFIEGKDELSTQFAETIQSAEISSRLEQDHFVAIKIESGTETYRFFAQIYQVVPVPCIYFIDTAGLAIEVIASNYQIPEVAAKIDDLLVKQGKSASGSSTSLIQSEQKASSENSQANVTSTESTSAAPPATSELTHEEKVKRAQQLIELQKKQRIEEEIKKEKDRELERRKREREMQEMRLKQRDLEIKQSHEERLKEKAEDAAARERVRQQIAQDKLLRKERELALKKQADQQSSEKQQIIAPVVTNHDSSLARIQFRLPSGGTHMGQFEPTVTLGTLRNYVSTKIEIPFQQFTLSTSFPRKDLLSEDDNKSLIELGLTPTCVILVLPLNSNSKSIISSSNDVGFLSRIIWTIFSPVIGVYNYVMRYFFNPNRGPGRSQNDETNSGEFSDSGNENSQDASNMQRMGGLHRRNPPSGSTKVYKVQGNIHRLHSPRDDDDENNTWNGNSTQQM
ncbi:UBX domain-containing protein 4 [Leptopilina heterotoma]|uniref:UBX domain-containing protein 4 n=1 Tax=Leptopilina heterotoma TaxID=63436 RepID=UPI001CA930AC|nr:UBX domain-containing protein 4 [Leptopilina heterotoma]